jgi:hypothetical protein
VALPDCDALLMPPAEVVRLIDTPPDLSSYVRKEELREVADRITRAVVSKRTNTSGYCSGSPQPFTPK